MNNYDLELNRIIEEIKNNQAKLVCIQLPDGLKPEAAEIEKKIKLETKAQVLIWLGSCYGACDLPWGLKEIGVDLFVTFGHNVFHKEMW
ncbi:diphthamide synthesis protein [Candidatus Woesearchaeota archaeon]|nr:diphthamide synthesis protein [Candidatus Woesearchaeota archaeon]